ncbi:conserved Plasmodium protein, unknown function [Plasmodium berghei]|uniref:Uncharacterized protein n=2 Tax=Plasmodium berghei TaxID=5821 RepID=A0A509ANM0_PLABA|nr:conserved Plasmodium protein, unknown function [Plasmodium berghei ANKA]CXI76583.1 conserved Plasmodium protein, unknown function [Plasmodium berghei]SCM24946.1 conserved Plasmodium protein, unknown function [Plasmodium berghei]SCN27215.1 conserved Plasmodium protein, unknown function [Plasmodium berghei]SCO61786.1 conserved Plasmodium protein, unknown function [Plasmodium berghei]SCO63639.1 conserved Plasmodium protein, unknown function [Plasmodium berghei]|eukprot:XP_034422850.1 conserved Plasmodium protein, unknown function [Plasmodium berghei ANKA]
MNSPPKYVNCIEDYSARLNIINRQFENEPENITSKAMLIDISGKNSYTSHTPLINKTQFVNCENNNEHSKVKHKIFSSLLKKIRNGKEKASINIKNYYDKKKKYAYIYEKNLDCNKKKFTLLNYENDDSININNDTNICMNDRTKINRNASFLKIFQNIKNESNDGEVTKLRDVKIDGNKQNEKKKTKKIENYLINLHTNQNSNNDNNDAIFNPHVKYLRNIKKLLHISDEDIKDVIEISKFEINLNINTFYYKFINENNDNSLLKYNVNYNKNVYDIQEKRGHKNEKIISYKKKFSIGFFLHQYNISIQEKLYYCYRIYEAGKFEDVKNNMKCNIDHRKYHNFCAGTNGLFGNFKSIPIKNKNYYEYSRYRKNNEYYNDNSKGKEFYPENNLIENVEINAESSNLHYSNEITKICFDTCKFDEGYLKRSKNCSQTNCTSCKKKKQNISDNNSNNMAKIIRNKQDCFESARTENKGNLNNFRSNFLTITGYPYMHNNNDKKTIKGKKSSNKIRNFLKEIIKRDKKDIIKNSNNTNNDYHQNEKNYNKKDEVCKEKKGGGEKKIFKQNDPKELFNNNSEYNITTNKNSSNHINNRQHINIKKTESFESFFKTDKIKQEFKKFEEDIKSKENYKDNLDGDITFKCTNEKTNVYEQNYDKYCSGMKYEESINNSDEFLTSQYVDNNFNEIYYIQRINANNDTFSVFVKIYQIYIFSRANNEINIDNKADKNHDNNNGNASNKIKGYRNLEDSYEKQTNSHNSNKTKVSVYVFITILSDSLLKYIIKKKILYDVTNCINQWEIDIITEIQNLNPSTNNISMSIKTKEWNDNIYCIIKNIEIFINDYLKVFIHNIAINVIYFFGIYENNMLQNYISFLKTEDSNNLHTRKKYTFKSIYNDIKKKIQRLKPKKKRRSNEHRQKKRQSIPQNQNYKKGYNLFQNMLKQNDGKKKHTFFYDDACFFNHLTIEKKKCYFKSHHEANSYVAYINSIYYRRIMFLYILFFFVYITITKTMPYSCYV